MGSLWNALGRRTRIALLLVLAAVLSVAGLAILVPFAGRDEIVDGVGMLGAGWFAVAAACEVAAFLGYVLAYRDVARVEDGPGIAWKEAAQVVAVGFGAFIVRGGAELDTFALRRRGSDSGEARVRVLALDALEHAPLAPAAWLAAVPLRPPGRGQPRLALPAPWR